MVASTTQTISSAPTISGSAGNEVGFISATVGTQATISVATGTAAFSWSSFHDIAVTGGAAFNATNSFDLGHNSGFSILTPPSAGGPNIIGGWLLESDLPENNTLWEKAA